MAETKVNNAGEQQPVDEQSRYAKMSASELSEELAQEIPSDSASIKDNRPMAYKFARRDTKSHKNHAKEMNMNQREYEHAAVDFFNGEIGELYYNVKDEKYYRYDVKSRKIATCDKDGNIHTFFIAKNGWFDKNNKEMKHV